MKVGDCLRAVGTGGRGGGGGILLDNPIHMTELSVNNSGESSFYNFSSVQ